MNGWNKLEIYGLAFLEWFAWGFIAFFVIFILYAVIKGVLVGEIS